jgi:hypothetical protein
MTTTKPFDNDLYEADDNARELVKDWLNSYGWTLENNPDRYGIDLIGYDRLHRQASVEVEVKHYWTGSQFPFQTVHIAARKQKFIEPTAYIIVVNHDRTHALMLNYQLLSQGQVITKSTIYTKDEQFIEVPAIQANIREVKHESMA